MIIKMEVMLNTNLTTCSSIIVGKNCEPVSQRLPTRTLMHTIIIENYLKLLSTVDVFMYVMANIFATLDCVTLLPALVSIQLSPALFQADSNDLPQTPYWKTLTLTRQQQYLHV